MHIKTKCFLIIIIYLLFCQIRYKVVACSFEMTANYYKVIRLLRPIIHLLLFLRLGKYRINYYGGNNIVFLFGFFGWMNFLYWF